MRLARRLDVHEADGRADSGRSASDQTAAVTLAAPLPREQLDTLHSPISATKTNITHYRPADDKGIGPDNGRILHICRAYAETDEAGKLNTSRKNKFYDSEPV